MTLLLTFYKGTQLWRFFLQFCLVQTKYLQLTGWCSQPLSFSNFQQFELKSPSFIIHSWGSTCILFEVLTDDQLYSFAPRAILWWHHLTRVCQPPATMLSLPAPCPPPSGVEIEFNFCKTLKPQHFLSERWRMQISFRRRENDINVDCLREKESW